MGLILDTNALSAWLDGEASLGDVLSGTDRVYLSPIVLGEYLFGVQFSRHRASYEEQISRICLDLPILRLDELTSRHYSEIRRELREAGRPIPWHDLWIAAQARQHGLEILSRDAHFDLVRRVVRTGW